MDEQARQSRRLETLTWAFVALGVVLRLFRYGRNFPLWGDESFVAVNFITRGYGDLLKPLAYGQIILRSWLGSPACSARSSFGGSIGSSLIRRERGRTGSPRTCSSSSSSPDPGRRSPPRPSRAESC